MQHKLLHCTSNCPRQAKQSPFLIYSSLQYNFILNLSRNGQGKNYYYFIPFSCLFKHKRVYVQEAIINGKKSCGILKSTQNTSSSQGKGVSQISCDHFFYLLILFCLPLFNNKIIIIYTTAEMLLVTSCPMYSLIIFNLPKYQKSCSYNTITTRN